MPIPCPQIPLGSETYWLEWSEGTWELYTRRGSKGRTRHTEDCDHDLAALRRRAIALAAHTGVVRGAVLYIYPFRQAPQIHYFYPVHTWPLNSPATIIRACQCQLIGGTGKSARPLTMAENTTVTFLHIGADQDGWNGELLWRLGNGQSAAFQSGDIAISPTELRQA